MRLPALTLFLLFIIWTTIKRKKAERNDQKKIDSFWEREYAANQVIKKDISHLDYIKIPLDSLPLNHSSDETLSVFEKNITALESEPVLNLSDMTNTDLKLNYGVANLEFLSKCDQNFVTLTKTLYEWGQALYDLHYVEDAVTVLEYGIQCETDISGHYTLLASIYQERGEDFKIQNLILAAEKTHTLMKDSIIKKLKSL